MRFFFFFFFFGKLELFPEKSGKFRKSPESSESGNMFSCGKCFAVSFHLSDEKVTCISCSQPAYVASCVVFDHKTCLVCLVTHDNSQQASTTISADAVATASSELKAGAIKRRLTTAHDDQPSLPSSCRVCDAPVLANPRKHWNTKKHAQYINDSALETQILCRLQGRRPAKGLVQFAEATKLRVGGSPVVTINGIRVCLVCGGLVAEWAWRCSSAHIVSWGDVSRLLWLILCQTLKKLRSGL
jgi:hypothetical protein